MSQPIELWEHEVSPSAREPPPPSPAPLDEPAAEREFDVFMAAL
jgi:hypothetical protein